MIYYFTPYDRRGLGYAYNEACSIVPRLDDWIVLMDGDVMLTTPKWGEVIERAIRNRGPFELLTCYATRIYMASPQQHPNMMIREQRDLVVLKKFSEDQASREEIVEVPTENLSGFFLCFQKKLWVENPFPTVGSKGDKNLGIDTAWVRHLHRRGVRTGRVNALIAIHYYRLANEGKEHLK